MKTIYSFFLYTSVVVFGTVSCVKNIKDNTIRNDDFTNKSQVQFINVTVSATRNSIYMDGIPLNHATISYGGQFPASPNVAFAVSPGIRSFEIRDTLITSTQLPVAFLQNFQVSNRYTIFLYDSTTTAKQKTVQTDIQIPADTTARLRFANFVYAPGNPGTVDIYSLKRNSNIFSNVAVTDVTNFIPYASNVTDTFFVRQSGTTTNLQNRNPTTGAMVDVIAILTPTQKRSYTLLFRGGFRTTATNATTVRALSTYINY